MLIFSTQRPSSSLLASAALLTFTVCATTPARAQCRNTTMPDFFRVGVLLDKPFIAERLEVQLQAKKSGKDQIDIYKQSVSRDSLGRIRVETHLFSKFDEGETRQQLQAGNLDVSLPEKETQHWIEQMDCTANRHLLIQPEHRSVLIMEISAPGQAQPALRPYGSHLFQKYANMETADLGFTEIAGIKSHGAKWISPPSPTDPGNPAYVHQTETWVSQEWALTLKETFRRPEPDQWMEMRVLAFSPEEPDPASFQVPADYKTVTNTARSGNPKDSLPANPSTP